MAAGPSHFAQEEYFDLEVAAFIFYVEHVAGMDLSGGFGGLSIAVDAAEFTGAGGKRARFEKAGGPEPLVDSDARHDFIVAGDKVVGMIELQPVVLESAGNPP